MTPTLCPNSSESGVGPAHSSAFSRELVNRVSESNEDQPHPGVQGGAAAARRQLQLGGGKSVFVFDSTVIEVQTDAGVTGYGEVCPLGPYYLPAYANGVRAGIQELDRICLARILWNYRN